MISCPQLFYRPLRGAAAARVGEEDENIFTPIRVSHYNLTYRRPWANMLSLTFSQNGFIPYIPAYDTVGLLSAVCITRILSQRQSTYLSIDPMNT